MALPYNPLAIPYGNVSDVTCSNGQTYVPENITPSRTTKEINREDKLGAPSGFVLRADKRTGSMVLQMATVSQALPAEGDTITYDFGYGSKVAVITQVGNPRGQNEDWKVNVDFRLDEPFV